MLRLKRHIVTEITEIFFAVIIALILIMISFQFAKLLSEAASGKIVGSAIYKLVALQTVNLFVLLTPFAFFIATIIGLSKLATDNELIAMKSIGYSDYRLYQAIFTIAVPLAIVTLFLTLNTLPNVLSLSYQLKYQAKKESELSVIQPGNFRNLGSDATIFVADVNNKEFSKFFVWQRNNNSESITVAQTGKQFEKDGERLIELKNGSRYSWDPESSYLMQFEKLIGKLPDIKKTSRSERLKSTSTVVLLEKPSLINRVEIQRRLAPGISILLLALFAPLLVQFNPRENKYGKFVIAILAYALYSNTQVVFQTLTVKGHLPVYLGLHTSHIIVFVLTIFLMYRKSDWHLSRLLLRGRNG
ncbi:MAG: LPS export ABC transporter permease LptF [Gammaproteobacteria bacterium]|nr:LPS export ABC transporter permease LptF [Gammaproteobacteria bacterium]